MSGHDTKLSIDTTSIVYNEIILNLLNLAAPFFPVLTNDGSSFAVQN
jgi:hypothetical protein